MIALIHGSDVESSSKRLRELTLKYEKYSKIRLDKEASDERIYEALFATSLTGDLELVILKNLLKNSKKLVQFFEKLAPKKEIIFWEDQDLDSATIAKLPKTIKVEYFKKSNPIYAFLDSLVPKSKTSHLQLKQNQDHLLWNLQNRILQLIVAKIGYDQQKAKAILGIGLADWQWQKIVNQSTRFELKKLLSLYQGALKVDYLIKTGKTRLDENTLTSILLLKYLQ